MITQDKYDLRQLRLMENKISLFVEGSLSLFSLVCDLSGLLQALETVPETWKDNVRDEVNSLEYIQDSIEDGSIVRWKGDYKAEIDGSIFTISKLVTSLRDEYLKKADPNVLETATVALSSWLVCPDCNHAWESDSKYQMIICSNCESVLNNPLKSEES